MVIIGRMYVARVSTRAPRRVAPARHAAGGWPSLGHRFQNLSVQAVRAGRVETRPTYFDSL